MTGCCGPCVAPSRGRGSKPRSTSPATCRRVSPPHGGVDRNRVAGAGLIIDNVAPSRGRGSKLGYHPPEQARRDVAPSRGRGSKPPLDVVDAALAQVAPSRGRGSKHRPWRGDPALDLSPLTGAWIETEPGDELQGHGRVAPSRGRGSKLSVVEAMGRLKGSPPHGGVDRNWATGETSVGIGQSPPHGGVDRNDAEAQGTIDRLRSPPHGGVDRNVIITPSGMARPSRPLTGAWIETPAGRLTDRQS